MLQSPPRDLLDMEIGEKLFVFDQHMLGNDVIGQEADQLVDSQFILAEFFGEGRGLFDQVSVGMGMGADGRIGTTGNQRLFITKMADNFHQ